MNKQIVLDSRELEEAEIIGTKRFQANKKKHKSMSFDNKKQKDSSRDILGVEGEIAFEKWCIENSINYISDYENVECRSSKEDNGDGTIYLNRKLLTVEVKTTTAKNPHLVVAEYRLVNPSNIYVLIRKMSDSKFKVMGFATPELLEDYYDDTYEHTVNRCYRMCHTHLIQDWEDFVNVYFGEE